MGSLLGGKSTSSSKSGYSALSKSLQAAFDPFGQAINKYMLPGNPGVNEMFTPSGITAQEQLGIDRMRQGFTPTAQSLQSDIEMQMNPYNKFVIDEINRQGGGQYSLLKQALSEAGQSGSNRSILGANDIDLSRQNMIGNFLGGQFNTAMQNAMTTLPSQRTADLQNMMSAEGMVRGLADQQKMAPISAIEAGTSMMSPFISGNNKQYQSQSQSPLSAIGGLAMGLGGFMPGLGGSMLGMGSRMLGGGGWLGNTFYG